MQVAFRRCGGFCAGSGVNAECRTCCLEALRAIPYRDGSHFKGHLGVRDVDKSVGLLCYPLAAMAFLLGDRFKEEEDDVNELPHDLRDIYINPWKVSMSRDGAPIGHLLHYCGRCRTR